MANRTRAVRYARALADALPGTDELGAAQAELEQAIAVLDDAEAQRTIGSPVLPGTRRRELTENVFVALGFSPVVKRLVALLAEKNQIGELAGVARAVSDICDQRRNIVAAEVATAVELTDDKKDSYRTALEQTTGQQVRLQTRVDPSLLGGVVTRVGAQVYDGSVRRQLELLHQRLKGE